MERMGTLKMTKFWHPRGRVGSGREPDPDFLYKLHKWNIAHKDDKLPAVLTKVNSVLESKPLEAALEFIPNSPFPAKSLVKAMVNLFLLGSKIPQAKQDIYSFSIQIVVDITNLAVVFGETGGGQLSQKAWEDLKATKRIAALTLERKET